MEVHTNNSGKRLVDDDLHILIYIVDQSKGGDCSLQEDIEYAVAGFLAVVSKTYS